MIAYLRFLSGRERTREANRHLGMTLAFVAGAVDAGGFVAVGRYTSHMTGLLSSIAGRLAMNEARAALFGTAAFFAFLFGAGTSAILINWTRRKEFQSQYASSLMLEGALLLTLGVIGKNLAAGPFFVPATVLVLCYMMGLQNAIITKISGAEIRTTHMTGNTTDLGIELGKLLYWNRGEDPQKVVANREKLKIHGGLIGLFVLGGVAGARAFKSIGFAAMIPLALLLFAVAAVPVLDDLVRARSLTP